MRTSNRQGRVSGETIRTSRVAQVFPSIAPLEWLAEVMVFDMDDA